MEYLESEDYLATKQDSLDAYHVQKIYFEEAIRILKQDSLETYKKWHKNNYLQNLRANRHGVIHLSEYARTHNMTNTEFLREHLMARAQGEAVRDEVEKEKREKADRKKGEKFIRGKLNSDI